MQWPFYMFPWHPIFTPVVGSKDAYLFVYVFSGVKCHEDADCIALLGLLSRSSTDWVSEVQDQRFSKFGFIRDVSDWFAGGCLLLVSSCILSLVCFLS